MRKLRWRWQWLWLWLWAAAGAVLGAGGAHDRQQQEHLVKQTKAWADRLGADLWLFGNMVTRRALVADSYRQAEVVRKDGDALVKEVAARIKDMMDAKVAAVQRIMDAAGNLAVSQPDDVGPDFDYYNAKTLINNLTDPDTGDADEDGGGDGGGTGGNGGGGGAGSDGSATAEGATLAEAGGEPRAQEYRGAGPPVVDDGSRYDAEDGGDDEGDDDDDGGGGGGDAEDEEDEAAPRPRGVTDGGEDAAQASQQGAARPDKRRLNLTENVNFFDIPVNTEHSAVHVPSNVYDGAKEVMRGIQWSEKLDSIFKNNYNLDPTLSWQYFGSATGFMRQFPAMVWRQDPIDLFDCRTRSWFIEAATSPKDVVVLVDRSGSMTGMRREIAKHVVTNILDTLGNNDYVNVFTFSNVTEPLLDCFNDTLVQANLANVRQLKQLLDDFRTDEIANFADALTVAFELLKSYRVGSRNKSGAGCNQAIMLITDGVQYNYKELFEKYNWADRPYMPVRVFTYLIGREVSDEREVRWMACANQGFYVHLSTFAEVREQVLQYVPVMARPLVLWARKPQPTWSPVYADVADPKLTNWLWVQRQRRDQKDRFLAHRRNRAPPPYSADLDRRYVHRLDGPSDGSPADGSPDGAHGAHDLQAYTLMTSVSMPVYDSRPNANITEHILVKEAHWITVTRETRVANLLGVAGTDVPIRFIQQLMSPHSLGVNGYAFIITNNGYILIHPDLRPVFQGILKPAYNRVDLAEVELTDDDLEPRDFNASLLAMRKEIIFRMKGRRTLDVKYHLDDMRRVIRGRRHYFYEEILGTPFSLVVALPHRYGAAKIQPPGYKEDIHRMVANENTITKFFAGDKWRIHPDWLYCRDLTSGVRFNTSEDEMRHTLSKMQQAHWKWAAPHIKCDRNLVQNLVFDAKQTRWFDQNIGEPSKAEKGRDLIQRFGITTAFMATHSGLTRWQDFPQNVRHRHENATAAHASFGERHNRAIDEVWYRRAVEQHYVEEESFVYSVPFGAGADEDALVTASHAVFVGAADNKTAVAVVGYQFYRSALHALLRNVTAGCGGGGGGDELSCYVLDDNAYVVAAPDAAETGRWFGDVRAGVMAQLVRERVYRPVHMYDYQAVCFPAIATNNPAARLGTPFRQALQLLRWAAAALLALARATAAHGLALAAEQAAGGGGASSEPPPPPAGEDAAQHGGGGGGGGSDQPATRANEKEFDRTVLINKTRPTPCDERRFLYELVRPAAGPGAGGPYNRRMANCSRPFIVQNISASNLVLVVVRDGCGAAAEPAPPAPRPEEVSYKIDLVCRIRETDLPRKRINQCTNFHANESAIVLCGGGASPWRRPAVAPLAAALLHLAAARAL